MSSNILGNCTVSENKQLTHREEASIRGIVSSMATFEKGNSHFKNLNRAAREVEKMLSNLYDLEVRIEIMELFEERISIIIEGR